PYVAFVIGVYNDDYKKKLNNFDDFLSAPSPVFTLVNVLATVSEPIVVDPIPADIDAALKKTPLVVPTTMADQMIKDDTYFVAFNVTEFADYSVDYRCMFLPAGKDISRHMLTDKEFDALKKDEKEIQTISNKFDPQITAAQSLLMTVSTEIENTNTLISELSPPSKTAAAARQTKGKLTPLEAAQKKLKMLTAEYTMHSGNFNKLQTERQQALDNLTKPAHDKLGFMFNLTLAEQVLAGNYITANKYPIIPTATSKEQKAANSGANSKTEYFCFTSIGPDTTDNFGNSLISGNSYYPMILSFSTAEEDNLSMFQNALTDVNQAKRFTYNLPNN
ncbi:MAG: hypothetical protein M3N14_01630, partial [Bacteroidota bacterium]|nr:hypothetical protein [Bacteroidota bacterium]